MTSRDNEESDILDVISFVDWKTIDEITEQSRQKKSLVKKVIKDQIERGYLDQRKDKYRYDNSF